MIEAPSLSLDAELELLRQEARNDLLFYSRYCDPKFKSSRFHQRLAQQLERTAIPPDEGPTSPIETPPEGGWSEKRVEFEARRRLRRMILNVPPQHGKSRMTSMELTTWLHGKFPWLRLAVASYSQDLSGDACEFAANRIQSEQYQNIFPDTKLYRWRRDQYTTTKGGFLKAVSTSTPLTGKPLDGLIIDDPLKDADDARSLARRNAVFAWYLSTAFTRLQEHAFIILIMTRWHVDDLAGRLMDPRYRQNLIDADAAEEDFEQIIMPAIAEEGDWLGRKPGEELCAHRYSLKTLLARRAVYQQTKEGRHLWAAMFEQRPTVRGGNYIEVDKFVVKDRSEIPRMERWVRYWDLAATGKTTSDNFAGMKAMLDRDGNLWLDGGHEPTKSNPEGIAYGQWVWTKAREIIRDIAMAEQIEVGIESVAGFKVAFQNLREVVPSTVMLREMEVDKDKLTRALPWISLTGSGKVFLVKGTWIAPFFSVCEAFSGQPGDDDDWIDAVSGCWEMLRGGAGMYAKIEPERTRENPLGRIDRNPGKGRVLM